MKIRKFVLGVYQENAYLISDESTKESIVIDPGENPVQILEVIKSEKLVVKYILNTHAHIDHVLGVNAVKEATNAPFYLNENDIPLLNALPEQAEMLGLNGKYEVPEVDGNIAEGDQFSLGSSKIEVLFTPGHSPGSVTFSMDDMIFSGDVLFAGSVGRVDLPGGSWEILRTSINDKLFPLDRDTVVYSGHGAETTIGKEIDTNPFLQPGFEF
ncbi:MAG: MBL fold metallo-hydrolase [Candidatus Marinimicrobia bacterium]|nr:MBL fold metallo-hydrolase [Candidatus Neomarinimicrobiota bacterium]